MVNIIKETVSDIPCKDGNSQEYPGLGTYFSFSCSRNLQVTFEEKPQLKILSFQIDQH